MDDGRKDGRWTMDARATALALLTQLSRAINRAGAVFCMDKKLKKGINIPNIKLKYD